jgi:Ni/Co efflux regulator RcnB
MKRLLSTAIAFAFVAALGSGMADAKQCRDAKGKFTKCKTTKTASSKTRCRDSKGKFKKC